MDFQLLENFCNSTDDTLTLSPLDIDSRIQVHKWCDDKKYNSYSKGVHPNRYMVIEKRKREFNVSDYDMKEFIKEYKLPIPIISYPYINYYLDLYEKDFQSMTNYNKFVELLKVLNERRTNLKSYKNNLLKTIVDTIKNTDTYKELQKTPIKSQSISLPQINICRQEFNQEDWFISLDIIKANYSSYQCYHPDVIFNTNSWNEFMRRFTDLEYFIESKPFRQIIFGNLNMKINEALWKNLTSELYNLLKETNVEIIGKISDDELIIKTSKDTIENDLQIVNDILSKLGSHGKYWKVTPFHSKCVAMTDTLKKYYIKTNYYTKKSEIKGCDKEHYAQLYKKINNLELHEYDKKAMLGDEIVTFDFPMKLSMC